MNKRIKAIIFPTDDPKQALRISRFLMALSAYFICVFLCYFAYIAGFVTSEAFYGWVTAAVSINIVLFILFRTGLNLKMPDPSLTTVQMCSAIVMVMYIMMFANETRGVFLLIYVVILLFGIYRLNTRSFLYVSIFTLLTYGGVIVQLHLYRPQGVNFHMEYLQWVVLAGVVMLFSVIGGHISGLRDKISKDRSTIQRLTNNIPDVIFVFDTNLNCTYVSPSVKSLLGYEPEEVLKQKAFHGVAASSLDLTKKTLSNVMELAKNEQNEDISRTIQMEINRKDGIPVWTEMKFAVIRDKRQKSFEILAVMRDITERKKMEEALKESEEKHRNIIETIQDGYCEVDLEGNFTFFNDATCEIYGYSREELIGMSHRQIADKENAKKIFKIFNEIYRTGRAGNIFDYELIRKDGTRRQIEISASLKRDSSGNPAGFRGTIRDATERKKMEEAIRQSEERYRTILEEMEDAYFEVDVAGNYTFVNDAVCRHLQYSREELIGTSFRDQMDKEELDKIYKAFGKIYMTAKPEAGINYKLLRKDGTNRFAEMTGFPLTNQQGEIIGFRGIGRDITERKLIEEQIKHLATHDVLTDLPTMRLAKDRLKMSISLAQRNKMMMAVMFIDLDGFKEVNDTLGHDAGDYVLKQVADRLLACVRASDTVARVGGDEFLIIANGIHVPENAEQIARKVIGVVSQPIHCNGGQAVVGSSIGIALCPNDGQDMDQLIKKADDAMYKIKKTGKNGYCFINSQ
jgi:diguanylate cyclase (GGDEF)-like protein/PAS domain S-box-containing protein